MKSHDSPISLSPVSELERLRAKQTIQIAAAAAASTVSTDTKAPAAVVKTLELSSEKSPLSEAEVKESVFYKDLELTTGALRNKVMPVCWNLRVGRKAYFTRIYVVSSLSLLSTSSSPLYSLIHSSLAYLPSPCLPRHSTFDASFTLSFSSTLFVYSRMP